LAGIKMLVEGTEQWQLTASNDSTSGNGFALDAIATGNGAVGGNLHIAGRFSAAGATSNKAISIPTGNPPAGPNNYVIAADSVAQSYFLGSIGIGTMSPTASLHILGRTG